MSPCLLVLSSGAAQAENDDELARLIGPGARVVSSKHFTVAHDTTDDAVRGLTVRLEATYQSVETYCRNNELPFMPPAAPLEILFFDSLEGFHRYGASIGFAAQGFNGFYHSGLNRSAFFNVTRHPGLEQVHGQIKELEARVATRSSADDRAAKRDALKNLQYLRNRRDEFVERLNRVVIQHEAVHHLFYNVGVHVRGAANPQWFVEGMACVFETPPSARGAGIGTTNQLRLADFRTACARESNRERLKPEDVRRAFDAGKFVSLRRLITEPELLDNAADANLPNYYAEAWSVAFFLQRTQSKKLAEYAGLLAKRTPGQMVSGEQELKLFETVFGPMDEEFERRWAKFIFELQFVPDLKD